MVRHRDQNERIEALRGLIERLSAPDLTLDEGQAVRGRLSDLLDRDESPTRRDPGAAKTVLV